MSDESSRLVLGIDPGIARTGYGFVRGAASGGLELVAYGVVTTEADHPQGERLASLHESIRELLVHYKPQSAAVEQLFFQRNVKTAMIVGQARGVILLALANAGLAIAEYTPGEIKQAITGYGGADKVQMQHMVQRLLAMEEMPRPDDAADALAVAICHLHTSMIQARLEEQR